MAKRKFKTKLTVSGIEQLKQQLLQYKNVELPNKCRELAQRLMELGVTVASAKISESPLGKYITLKTDIDPNKMGCKAVLIAIGEVKESEDYEPFNILLAVEFGAGIRYNQTANPLSDKFGYGVGTFPNQVHAFKNEGWFYWDENAQEWRHSYGVKATMPMYNASVEIIRSVEKIAREVFG